MIRVRASTLEKFRSLLEDEPYDNDETDYEQELIDYVKDRQEGVPNERMRIGTAWHKVLEDPEGTKKMWTSPNGRATAIVNVWDGFIFRNGAVVAANEHLGPGLRELTIVKKISFPHLGEVELKGTIDRKLGLKVRDTKTKVNSTPNAGDYEDSLQWKIYLMLANAHEFTYDLFPAKGPDDNGFIEINEPMCFSFFRYPGMDEEVVHWLKYFLDWAAARDFLGFLEHTETK
jgi:hypothetical protein